MKFSDKKSSFPESIYKGIPAVRKWRKQAPQDGGYASESNAIERFHVWLENDWNELDWLHELGELGELDEFDELEELNRTAQTENSRNKR